MTIYLTSQLVFDPKAFVIRTLEGKPITLVDELKKIALEDIESLDNEFLIDCLDGEPGDANTLREKLKELIKNSQYKIASINSVEFVPDMFDVEMELEV